MKMIQIWRQNCNYEVNVYTVSSAVTLSNKANLPTASQSGQEQPSFKCRHVVALIGFAVYNFLTIHRMNMSVSIVAMVNNTAFGEKSDNASISCPAPSVNDSMSAKFDKPGEFDWPPVTQGFIQSSSFGGYVSTLFLCGKAAERFGCKWVIFWGLFLSSLCTFLTPYAAWWNVNVLIVVQTVRGMAQGAFQPSFSVLTANWFPVSERGLLSTFMLVGQCMGSLIGGLGSGLLCDSDLFGGWPAVFHIFGSAGIFLSILIIFLLHENPRIHPSISQAEAKFILNNQENALSKRRPDVPWRSIFTSVPFYALSAAYFGITWFSAHFMVVYPTFLGTILHIPIDQNGMLSSLPGLLQTVCGLLGSWISSLLNRKNYVGVDKVRKMWNCIACAGYAAGLLVIYLARCDMTLNLVFLVFCMSFEGFSYPGCLIVPADMSPTFAGTIMGLVLTVGSAASFILPLVVGWVTNGNQTLEQWNKINFISIVVAVTSGTIFAVFGSAEVQPWNFVQENATEKKKPEQSDQTIRL